MPCVECHTIERRIMAHGLCTRCYSRQRARAKGQREKLRGHWLTPELIPEPVRHVFDFSKQETRPVGKSGKQSALHILSTCPGCGEQRWVIHSKARKRTTPYCLRCKNTLTNSGKAKGAGWFINNGYRVVDVSRHFPDQAEYIRKYLLPHTAPNWFKEHRVVALLHYGPEAAEGLIRHRDGNKLNNDPTNLLPGSDEDNSRDHADAIREMLYWKRMAHTLLWLYASKT